MKNRELEDLYNYPAYHDPKRPYMSIEDRAAQFMPFKPLSRGRDFGQDDDGDDEARAER